AGVSTVAIGEGKETPSQWRLTDSPEGLSLIFAADTIHANKIKYTASVTIQNNGASVCTELCTEPPFSARSH
ncbi:MAG: hypothetical protein LBR88_00330, partial [Zoogloeaceae bacterium]|nr:hypothetical protein [Zoogloeaceae bacterium]